MKTAWEVWVMRVGEGRTLEPVLDLDGAGALEFDSKEKAVAEAKDRLKDDDVERSYVLEKRAVEEYVSNREGKERPAAEQTYQYEVGAPADDLSLHGNEDYVDVRCPCGGRTGFTRKAVVDAGKDGLIGKCLRCSRHFKLGADNGAVKAWNVSLVPAK